MQYTRADSLQVGDVIYDLTYQQKQVQDIIREGNLITLNIADGYICTSINHHFFVEG